MKIFTQIWIIALVWVADICCECDVCQSTNFVACHEENIYSLCVNGSATNNFITCPKNHVCTPDPYVCYPKPEAKPSCERKKNLCGVCSENKVYACTNETTIAFCYGEDDPVEGAEVSYCVEDTVCDIFSEKGFCTESYLVEPSCVTVENKEDNTTTKISTETTNLDTTTTPEFITKSSTKEPITTTLTEQTTYPSETTERVATDVTTTSTAQPTTATDSTNIPTTTTTGFTTIITTIEAATTTRTTEPTTSKSTEITTTTGTVTNPITESSSKATTTMELKTSTISPETTVVTKESTTTQSTTEQIASTTTTSSTSPATPDEICKRNAMTGSFSFEDPTCTTFVICYKMKGSLTGLKKKCPDNQYFSPDAKRCSSEKPDVCV